MRLIFVRHGEPDYVNDCLTENGVVQARSTAKRLHSENIKAIYASPMGRAVETASYTAKDHELDIQVLDFMHEIDWGDIPGISESSETSKQFVETEPVEDRLPYEGHPWTLAYKLLTENPEYVGSLDWVGHHYFKDNRCTDFYQSISDKFDEFLKNYGLVRKGGLYYVEEKNDDTIALFAHGGSGAIMFSHLLSLPFPFVLTTMPYGVCSVSIIELGSDPGRMTTPRLELFNDMGHIDSFKVERLHFEK